MRFIYASLRCKLFLVIVMLVGSAALAVSCSEPPLAQRQAPSALPSPSPSKDFPLAADEFLESYHIDSLMKGNWVPTVVLGYTDSSENYDALANQTFNKTKWYIVSSKDGVIEVNEVQWVLDSDEPNGYRIDDPSPATKEYQISDDAQVWLIIGSDAFFRIPISNLNSYIASRYGPVTLWNYTMVNNKIAMLTEQYVP